MLNKLFFLVAELLVLFFHVFNHTFDKNISIELIFGNLGDLRFHLRAEVGLS